MNKQERLHLEQLVIDCKIFRLSENEALDYIKIRLGKSISSRHFYRIKKKVASDTSAQKWFDNHARIGFARDYRMRKLEMESIMGELMHFFKKQSEKTDMELIGLVRLTESIINVSKRLEEISLGMPVIQQIKKKIDEARYDKGPNYDYTQGTAFS